ncbi:MAG TPA: APC family permease [Ktedonobacteraceae bacterium]|nr:APC family permease [Ktedonobacteraceae bacterium]
MDDQDSPSLKSGNDGDATRHYPDLIDEDDPTRLVRTEVRKGSFPGNERVRVVLPSQRAFRRVGTGRLEATEVTQAPRKGMGRVASNVKRVLIGAPIASAQAEHERLTKFKALAVLSSDAISSVAYATEAILLSLVAAGSSHLGLTLPISFAIVGLLAIVAISYRQTIPAYPNGGGSYIVAKDNLGTVPGLIAAASLMIDYVLTVAVSVSAGVLALVTLVPELAPYVVPIDVALVIFITVVNLRGVRESGSIFAIPTYIFIASALLLIIVGSVKSFFIQHDPIIGTFPPVQATESLTLFLVLKSFAAGCSAMTGVEAISNGVPAFKKPEARNARMTLTWMAVILGTLFIGLTLLATSFGIEANQASNPTVVGQIAFKVFTGPLYFMYPVFQIATLLILTLAANTSYSDFPRLASLLARDKFLPNQFAFRGDRLAFTTGIVFLALLAILLLIVFQGVTTQLINLYAVGVFLSFTLSQGGMVLHWWRLRRDHKGWLRSMIINGLGSFTTFIVALVIASTKFLEGAWIVVILIPLLVMMFLAISRHYNRVEREKVSDIPIHPQDIHHRVIVPIAGLDRAAIQSLAYARSITKHVIAVHVAIDLDDANKVREAWERWQKHLAEEEETQLIIIESPYRSLSRPLLAYIDTIHELFPADTVTVILAEFVVAHWWEQILHNQTALRLKASLFFHPGIVVTSVPQHLRSRSRQ